MTYDNPYFGRIDISSREEPHMTCYLSKRSGTYCTNNSDCVILGFGDTSTELVQRIFERFYSNSVEKIHTNNSEYKITISRRIRIDNGELIEVSADYQSGREAKGTTDLFLLKVLESRRKQTGISDIIATIQDKQYKIIKSRLGQNIIIQGCAGSGKTQILLQRLFFLKQSQARMDLNSVMIITPTRIFSFFSHDLLRRFGLSKISQVSLAEYYWKVLNAYDPRFKNRQYNIIFSEEYLPDEYLKAIYSGDVINEVEKAIESAIERNIKKAEIKIVLDRIDGYSENLSNKEKINRLVKAIDLLLSERKSQEELLVKNKQYIENNKVIAEIKRKRNIQERRQGQIQKEIDELTYSINKIKPITNDICEIKISLQDIDVKKKNYRKSVNDKITELVQQANLEDISGLERYGLLSRWCALKQEIQSFDNSYGERYRRFQEEVKFFNDVLEERTLFLKKMLNTDKIDKIEESMEKRMGDLKQRLYEVERNLNDLDYQLESAMESNRYILSQVLDEKGLIDGSLLKEMESVRYYLSRIETAVFEQEVWSVIAPYKQKYGVKDIEVSEYGDGNSKRKILYKSDLMFYLRIYLKLYGIEKIEQKSLICIDEAQDLNEADYRILHELQPNAAVNIYGDTHQVLHENYGINSWESLPFNNCEVHFLDENYRNAPQIVEFCNKSFHTNMKAFGVSNDQVKVTDWSHISEFRKWLEDNIESVAVIVKDDRIYHKLINALDICEDNFYYLNADAQTPKESAINVYSIYAVKGLEFPMALVIADGMNENQRYVAVTRAMEQLVYCE